MSFPQRAVPLGKSAGPSERPMQLRLAWRQAPGARAGERERGSPSIGEFELHAFADGALAPREHARVAAYLARHPEEAARTEDYRRQNIGLCLLYGATPLPHFPDRRLEVARRAAAARAARARARAMLWTAVASFTALLAAALGLWAYR
jgi:anti-sigma factor RsiW